MTPDEIVNEANRLTELGGQLKTLAKWRATCAQFSPPVDCVCSELHTAVSGIAKDALRAEVARWFADGLAAWEARVCGEMRAIARGMSAEEKPLELSRGDVVTAEAVVPWLEYIQFVPALLPAPAVCPYYVRWVTVEGQSLLYSHKMDRWVATSDEKPFPTLEAARQAAALSPEPPTWKEFEERNKQNEE